MISFKEYYTRLYEAPAHFSGDAPFQDDEINKRISDVSKIGIDKDYILIKKDFIKKLDLYEHTNGTYFIVGKWYTDEIQEKERFAVISDVSFTIKEFNSKQKQLKGKYISIDTVHTTKEWRHNGISTAIYSYILSKGYDIMSDKVQYDGAVELWKGFLTVPGTVIYIYDNIKDEIISKMTKNTHYNNIWSLNNFDKSRIRLIFKEA